jgi:hypothetical protein
MIHAIVAGFVGVAFRVAFFVAFRIVAAGRFAAIIVTIIAL